MSIFVLLLACESQKNTKIDKPTPVEPAVSTSESVSKADNAQDGSETKEPFLGWEGTLFRGYDSEGTLGELQKNCARCRKRPSPIEQSFIEQCKEVKGEVFYCGCFDILCSVRVEGKSTKE